MHKQTICIVVALVCCGYGLCYAGGTKKSDGPVVVTNPTAEARPEVAAIRLTDDALRAILSEPISVHLDEAPLVEVIHAVFYNREANVFVDWHALAAAGIERSTPMTVELDDLPREKILRLVLTSATSLCEFDPVGHTVQEGVVRISTERELDQYTQRHVYNIGPLIRFWSLAEGETFSGIEINNQDAKAYFEEEIGEACMDPGRMVTTDPTERLIEFFQDTVGRQENWDVYGGDVASIQMFGDHLLVEATPDMLREIEELLGMFRQQQVEAAMASLREAEIANLLKQADEKRMKQEYAAALELVERAERVDPRNVVVIAMKRVLTDTMSRQ